MFNILNSRATQVVNTHINKLVKKRCEKILYRRTNSKGKLFGRSFEKDKDTYKKCIKDNIPIVRISVKDKKKVESKKYLQAQDAVFSKCDGNCKKIYCPYDHLSKNRINLSTNPVDNLKLILYNQKGKIWDIFAKESNFAPTKQVLKLLGKDLIFMKLLEKTSFVPVLLPIIPSLFERKTQTENRKLPLLTTGEKNNILVPLKKDGPYEYPLLNQSDNILIQLKKDRPYEYPLVNQSNNSIILYEIQEKKSITIFNIIQSNIFLIFFIFFFLRKINRIKN